MKLHKIRNTEEIYTGKRENKERWRQNKNSLNKDTVNLKIKIN